ncbi:Endophilin-A3 [Galemys pyrenaicus]|uniref:Endophilin-A3 n=1 Tax=Galemys pyrenaicus TaxID=202257 RepID=A0A8J6ASZ6_GALPY|nr:Endophilin-A3 [Galemys pyrenaicus]
MQRRVRGRRGCGTGVQRRVSGAGLLRRAGEAESSLRPSPARPPHAALAAARPLAALGLAPAAPRSARTPGRPGSPRRPSRQPGDLRLSPQLFSEKITGAEGTKLDSEFLDMGRKIDVTSKAVAEILSKTTEYLQPNPGVTRTPFQAYRAKLGMLNTVSKLRGQVKTTGYPQTEGLLGDCLLKYGKELGEDSSFGQALLQVGESMKLMAEVKDALDISVKQMFVDPLQLLQDKDLKEIGHHLRKLEGRRLDYDYKRRRVGKIPEEEVRQAVDKFEESRELAERSMFNFLENDVEQVSQLAVFVEAALEYHRQSAGILQELQGQLQARIAAAASVPRREYKPRPLKRTPSELSGLPAACSTATGEGRLPAGPGPAPTPSPGPSSGRPELSQLGAAGRKDASVPAGLHTGPAGL